MVRYPEFPLYFSFWFRFLRFRKYTPTLHSDSHTPKILHSADMNLPALSGKCNSKYFSHCCWLICECGENSKVNQVTRRTNYHTLEIFREWRCKAGRKKGLTRLVRDLRRVKGKLADCEWGLEENGRYPGFPSRWLLLHKNKWGCPNFGDVPI